MKIKNINNKMPPSYTGSVLHNKFAKTMSNFDHLGEGANIAFDFLGKALVVPLVIMFSSKEKKEKKQYSALKNPVAATIQLILEVPILYFGTMHIGNIANKGGLDKPGSDFSYNEKQARDVFMKEFRQVEPDADNILGKKGLSKKALGEIEDIIKNNDSSLLKESFKNFEATHKRLYHLQNRFCFAAALILTPALCALENKIHPKMMSFLEKRKGEKNV